MESKAIEYGEAAWKERSGSHTGEQNHPHPLSCDLNEEHFCCVKLTEILELINIPLNISYPD